MDTFYHIMEEYFYIKQIEKMYYNQDYPIYISQTPEITKLKDQILQQRIIYNKLQQAKKQFNRLKCNYQYNSQQKQDTYRKQFQQLINVTENSSFAIEELVNKRNYFEQQINKKYQKIDKLTNLRENLQQKGASVQQQLLHTQQKYWKVQQTLNQHQKTIKIVQNTINKFKITLNLQKQVSQQIKLTQLQMKRNSNQIQNKNMVLDTRLQQMKNKLYEQLKQVQNGQYCNLPSQMMQIENLLLRIQNQERLNQSYQYRLQLAQSQLNTNKNNKYLLKNESTTQLTIDQLMKFCTNNNLQKQQEYSLCLHQINELHKQISQNESVKLQLAEQINNKRNQLNQFKDKNNMIKNLLNTTFKQDSEIIKSITQKKVYNRQSKQIKQSVLGISSSINWNQTNNNASNLSGKKQLQSIQQQQ